MDKQSITFVTGGTGFVGAYLVRYLVKAGVRVRALKRASSPMELVADVADRVEWIEGDIMDLALLKKAMDGVTEVYHCAAIVSFDPRDREQMFAVNIEGTANIVDTCLSMNVRRLLYVSSITALGYQEGTEEINESAEWTNSSWNSNYGTSKFRAEAEVWRGQAKGLSVVVVNPSSVLGSGYWNKGTAALFETASKGMQYYSGGATGFVDVRDVAKAMIVLMKSDIEGERFILSSENMSWHDFMSLAAAQLGVAAPTKLMSSWFLGVFWRLEWLRTRLSKARPMLTSETAQNSTQSYYYSNTKVCEAIDYEFLPVATSVKETSAQFLATYPEGIKHACLPI